MYEIVIAMHQTLIQAEIDKSFNEALRVADPFIAARMLQEQREAQAEAKIERRHRALCSAIEEAGRLSRTVVYL